MPKVSSALFLMAVLVGFNAEAAPKQPAAKPELHCPFPGDPDGMAMRLGPQGQMYCAELEKFALVLEMPGIETLEATIAKAFEQSVYNEWTLAAEEALAEFNPAFSGPVYELPLTPSQSLL